MRLQLKIQTCLWWRIAGQSQTPWDERESREHRHCVLQGRRPNVDGM